MSEEYPDWQDETVKVVCNGERVCSIWPADRKNAPGWVDVGFSGDRAACLEYVKEHCDSYCRLKEAVEPAATAPQAGSSDAPTDVVQPAAG